MSNDTLWEDGLNSKMVFEHYGHDAGDRTQGIGMWPNDGTVFKRLSALPEALEHFGDPTKKIRVIFDYDPNYPRAMIQVWGMQKPKLDD